jgi:pimeloyl-ACP methyl ester carboxylesterase
VLYEPPIPTPAAAPAKDAPAIERLEALVAAGRREDALLSFYRDILHAPEAEIDKIRSDSDWPKRIALANTIPRELRAARGYVFDRARFAALTCPVLLVLGGDSPPRYQAATELLQESLPRCRTAVIGGQRHNAISMAPAAFVATVLGHLTDSVPVPAARQPT